MTRRKALAALGTMIIMDSISGQGAWVQAPAATGRRIARGQPGADE